MFLFFCKNSSGTAQPCRTIYCRGTEWNALEIAPDFSASCATNENPVNFCERWAKASWLLLQELLNFTLIVAFKCSSACFLTKKHSPLCPHLLNIWKTSVWSLTCCTENRWLNASISPANQNPSSDSNLELTPKHRILGQVLSTIFPRANILKIWQVWSVCTWLN